MKIETIVDATRETAKAAPAVTPGGLTFMGVPLPEWVLLASLLYTVCLIIGKLPAVVQSLRAFWRWVKKRRNNVKGK